MESKQEGTAPVEVRRFSDLSQADKVAVGQAVALSFCKFRFEAVAAGKWVQGIAEEINPALTIVGKVVTFEPGEAQRLSAALIVAKLKEKAEAPGVVLTPANVVEEVEKMYNALPTAEEKQEPRLPFQVEAVNSLAGFFQAGRQAGKTKAAEALLGLSAEEFEAAYTIPPSKPKKGEEGGKCNRSACDNWPAIYYNHSTRFYYCQECADVLNRENYADAQRLYGHDLCTLGLKSGIAAIAAKLKEGPKQ